MQAFDLVNREIGELKIGKLGFTTGRRRGSSRQRLMGKDIQCEIRSSELLNQPPRLNLIQLNNVFPQMFNPEELIRLLLVELLFPHQSGAVVIELFVV